MRRLFINLLVSLLTFVSGIGASVIQNIFTPSGEAVSSASLTATLQPSQSAARPVYTACGCGTEPSTGPAVSSSTKAPINGGVLNDKAINLPQPAYPAVAKAARAYGSVAVQITIDEQGCVISARALSGHPLLQAAAVQAAYQARFSPTRLRGEPVKVTGVVTYNFVL